MKHLQLKVFYFFYFEQTGEVLGRSWLSLQEQRESGIVDEAIRQMTGRAELMTDLQKWVSFSYDDVYYMLRAYCYNDVWIACYVPADQLTDSLRQLYQEEACQVLLLHSDGEVLSGQEIVGQWQLDQRMLAEGGTYYRRHGGRIQVVKADSAKLDISIAVVMQGYGGFGKIVILQAAVNTLGAAAVASVTAAGKVGMFFCCPYDALGSTMATYGGQNVGAKKPERLGQGIKASMIIASVYSVFALLIAYLFGAELSSLFVDGADAQLLADARMLLIINSIFFIPLAVVNVVRFLIQGMGFGVLAITAGVCEMVARSLAGMLLVPAFGFIGVCFASPLAWIFADAFLIPAYFHVRRKLDRIYDMKAE